MLQQSDSIEQRAIALGEQARRLPVTTDQEYALAVELLRRLRRTRKAWDALQRPAIRAAKNAHSEALEVLKKIDGPLAEAYDELHDRAENFVRVRLDVQQSALREAAQAQAAELKEGSADDLGQAFDTAVAAGDTAKANRILSALASGVTMPPRLPVLVAPPTLMPKVDGTSVAQYYTFDVVDEALVPRAYLMLDRKKITEIVDAMGLLTNIPGIRVRPESSLTVR